MTIKTSATKGAYAVAQQGSPRLACCPSSWGRMRLSVWFRPFHGRTRDR